MSKRILVLTQVIDRNDQALGFFHRWAYEFSQNANPLTIICLWKGDYALPKHVKVLSLGKERKPSKLRYVLLFYKYIWQERNNYDSVFVHMNEEYVLLGSLLWKILGKKVGMWRNHARSTFFTKYAVMLSDIVFCTSPKSYTAKFKKTLICPAGIDTSQYDGESNPKDNSILFFGRLSPVKNVHVFIQALESLNNRGVNFVADIVGSPVNPEDFEYEKTLHKLGENLVKQGKLKFLPGVKHDETNDLYRDYSLYVNLTPDGSLDKTMLEACASRTPVLLSNSAFRGYIPEMCQLMSLESDSASEKMKTLLELSIKDRIDLGEKLRKYVDDYHGLKALVEMLSDKVSN